MTELDQMWSVMLNEASQNAAGSGRSDVADYLHLRSTNDAIRTVGVSWLIDAAIEIASETQASRRLLTIEREEPYRFAHDRMQAVGSALHLRHGVRCLTLETGWTRTPTDGVMPGGALAIARLRHYGMPRSNATMMLVLADPLPIWKIAESSESINSEYLRTHIEVVVQ